MDWIQALNDVGYPIVFIGYLIYIRQRDEEKFNTLSNTFKESLEKIVDSLSGEINEVKEDVKDIRSKIGGDKG